MNIDVKTWREAKLLDKALLRMIEEIQNTVSKLPKTHFTQEQKHQLFNAYQNDLLFLDNVRGSIKNQHFS